MKLIVSATHGQAESDRMNRAFDRVRELPQADGSSQRTTNEERQRTS